MPLAAGCGLDLLPRRRRLVTAGILVVVLAMHVNRSFDDVEWVVKGAGLGFCDAACRLRPNPWPIMVGALTLDETRCNLDGTPFVPYFQSWW